MAHGQGATSNRRGGYGPFDRGPRGHGKDKSVKKAEQRSRDDRYQAAMEETRRAQQELDDLIEHQRQHPAMGAVAGAAFAVERRKAEIKVEEAHTQATLSEIAEAMPEVVPCDRCGDPRDTASVWCEKCRKEVAAIHNPQPEPEGFDPSSLPQMGDGHYLLAPTNARMLFKQGYHAAYVLRLTGCGWDDIKDLPYDEDGYGTYDRDKREEAEDECNNQG